MSDPINYEGLAKRLGSAARYQISEADALISIAAATALRTLVKERDAALAPSSLTSSADEVRALAASEAREARLREALEEIAKAKPERITDDFVQGPALLWAWAQRRAKEALKTNALLISDDTPALNPAAPPRP